MEQSVKDILADDFWIMPATPEYIDEGVPYITSKNIKNGIIDFTKVNYISQDAYENISKNRPILVGDILISMIGTLGETAEVKESDGSFYGQNMFLVRLDESKINKRYFLNFFKSNCVKRALEGKQNQSTQKYLKANHIEDLIIPVPALDEQKLIAKQLDKLAGIIALRNEELKYLDNLIKARFVELFGDPKTNPKEYTKITVEEAIEAGYIDKPFDGNHGSKHPKASEYVGEGIPFLMANNVVGGTVDQVNCSFIAEERANKLDKGFAKDNDVLITHKGTIGRSAVLRTDYEFVMLTPQVAAYRVKRGITSDYLCGYFGTDFFQNDMKVLAAAGGSTRAYAGITAQLQLHLIIPPLDEQKVYTDFIHQVDKSKFAS